MPNNAINKIQNLENRTGQTIQFFKNLGKDIKQERRKHRHLKDLSANHIVEAFLWYQFKLSLAPHKRSHSKFLPQHYSK